MSNDKDSILRKIKHCLGLSKSSNENEAAMALRQAHALMQKHNISLDDVELADIKESKADTSASRKPVQYQINLAHMIAHIFGCDFYIQSKSDGFYWDRVKYENSWVFVGLDMYAEIASYAFDVLNRQLKTARREYIKTKLNRVRLAKNKYARADEFCLGWVDSVEKIIRNLAPPSVNKDLIKQKMKSKNLTTGKALDRVSNSKATASVNDYLNGRMEGKNAQLYNAMNGSNHTGLLES